MKLSPHFTLEELMSSNKARSLGIDNTPPQELMPRLVLLADMLERIRSTLGVPVIVSSGYRCPALNRAVGSSSTSDHPQGHAADFAAPAFGTPYQICLQLAPLVSVLSIGQLIHESVGGKTWVHVSTRTPDKAVNRIITIRGSDVLAGIQEAA